MNSENNKEKQIEILGGIFETAKEIDDIKNKISVLSRESFPKTPKEVNINEIRDKYKKEIKIKWWIIVVTMFIAGSIGAYISESIGSIAVDIWLVGTIAYCVFITQKRNKMVNEEYDKMVEEYKKIELPKYNEEYSIWNESHREKIVKLNEELDSKKKELDDLNSQMNFIPIQYRNYEAGKYIYDVISTSNYTVSEAIEMYDRNKGLQIEQQKLNEYKEANKLSAESNRIMNNQNNLISQQNDVLTEGNKIAKEQNRTLDKMRKDNNLANAIGIVQNHNANKHLKNIDKKM